MEGWAWNREDKMWEPSEEAPDSWWLEDREQGASLAVGVLEEATKLISGDRDRQHGSKLENFRNIAMAWQGYWWRDVLPSEVAISMALMKIARTKTGEHNRDDYVDAIGYLAIALELKENEK